jgi:hypothetical protein
VPRPLCQSIAGTIIRGVTHPCLVNHCKRCVSSSMSVTQQRVLQNHALSGPQTTSAMCRVWSAASSQHNPPAPAGRTVRSAECATRSQCDETGCSCLTDWAIVPIVCCEAGRHVASIQRHPALVIT